MTWGYIMWMIRVCRSNRQEERLWNRDDWVPAISFRFRLITQSGLPRCVAIHHAVILYSSALTFSRMLELRWLTRRLPKSPARQLNVTQNISSLFRTDGSLGLMIPTGGRKISGLMPMCCKISWVRKNLPIKIIDNRPASKRIVMERMIADGMAAGDDLADYLRML